MVTCHLIFNYSKISQKTAELFDCSSVNFFECNMSYNNVFLNRKCKEEYH